MTKNGPRTWLRLKRMRSVMRVHCTRFPGSQELLRELGMGGREQCQSAVSPSLWTRDRDERRNPAKQACALHRCSPTSHATKLERNMRRGDPCLTSNVEVYSSAGLFQWHASEREVLLALICQLSFVFGDVCQSHSLAFSAWSQGWDQSDH